MHWLIFLRAMLTRAVNFQLLIRAIQIHWRGYIHKPSEGEGNPQGGDFYPQYQFGFGLSYTTFEYSNLTADKKIYSPGETATINVTVKNSGSRDGKEVVELFTSDLVASLTPDVKRLRAFEKVDLKAGRIQDSNI